jgi:hypothetical protein
MCITFRRAHLAVFFICLTASFFAESPVGLIDSIGKPDRASSFNPVFPYALTQSGAASLVNQPLPALSYVPTFTEALEENRNSPRLQSVFLNNDIIALYGKPGSRGMGLLGQYSLEGIEPVMNEYVRMYDAANGQRGVIPAFYIIYGTCWPEGEIGLLSDSVVKQYIEFAAARGWDVFLDHQIGKYTVESAMKKLLPYLKYPNVQLALDPEWRTTKPMQEIGYVTADEINTAQKMLQDYLIEHNLPGRRMLVIHQFKPKMISNRNQVRSDFDLVQLIHCADGFGSPTLKKSTYAQNAEAKNIPIKSFKLFLKPTIEGAGSDVPLMTPEDVFSLNPRPYLIMYQ